MVYTKALRIAGSNVEIMGDEGWGGGGGSDGKSPGGENTVTVSEF